MKTPSCLTPELMLILVLITTLHVSEPSRPSSLTPASLLRFTQLARLSTPLAKDVYFFLRAITLFWGVLPRLTEEWDTVPLYFLSCYSKHSYFYFSRLAGKQSCFTFLLLNILKKIQKTCEHSKCPNFLKFLGG